MRATAWTFLAVGATKAGSLLSERKVIALNDASFSGIPNLKVQSADAR
jgi:hypothetical protein